MDRLASMWSNTVCYVPIHSNFSQVENTAPFLQHMAGRLVFSPLHLPPNNLIELFGQLLYSWNTDVEKMRKEYSDKAKWPNVEVLDFNCDALLAQLLKDIHDRKRILVLLTASTNYGFGMSQVALFQISLNLLHEPLFLSHNLNIRQGIEALIPSSLIDVVPVGHCMYGCESCSVREHQIPLFFKRYITQTLPYTSKDIIRQYNLHNDDKKKQSVLICPSVGYLSFLTNDGVTHRLIELKKRYEDRFDFALKLHGFCYYNERVEEGGKSFDAIHPLHSLGAQERANAALLRENFNVVSEEHYNILPFFEAFDFIIADLDSSVTFEALYFSDKLTILAFAHQTHLKEVLIPEEVEYRTYLNLFKDENELSGLFASMVGEGEQTTSLVRNPAGRKFFEKKYGVPDGSEVQKLADARNWNNLYEAAEKAVVSEKEKDEVQLKKDFDKLFVLDEESDTVSVLDYLSRGLPLPSSIIDFTLFIRSHQAQLEAMGVPPVLWNSLYKKLSKEIFDAGSVFQFVQFADDDEDEEERDEDFVQFADADDEDEEGEAHNFGVAPKRKLRLQVLAEDMKARSQIFLVDHAWTTSPEDARKQLRATPKLLERMASLMEIKTEGTEEEAVVEKVWEGIWRYGNTYRVLDAEADPDGRPVWYLMDEVGSSVSHFEEVNEDEPNFRMVPFIYGDKGLTYSLIWPIKDCDAGDIVCRDFLEGLDVSKKVQRAIRGIPFGLDVGREEGTAIMNSLKAYRERLAAIVPPQRPAVEPVQDLIKVSLSKKGPLKVYTDIDFLPPALTWNEFKVVSSKEEADVIFMANDFGDFAQLKPWQVVNQFPGEECVTHKHRLLETVVRCWGTHAKWLPLTYNLNKELQVFVANHTEIEELKKGLSAEQADNQNIDNHWIVKPWNKARGLEIVVTDSLPCVVRMVETGPKLASKYISRPALYHGSKFDLRYIVLVRSVCPLDVYVYKMFWIRVANQQYSLDHFDEYEKHFTVMNYTAFKMQQILYTDFIREFEKENLCYCKTTWADIQSEINQMFKDIFVAATQPPSATWRGIVPSATSESQVAEETKQYRGLYGMDVMIDGDMTPRLLEVNFSPDCHRAVNYDPNFYNDVFATLFLENWARDRPEISEKIVRI